MDLIDGIPQLQTIVSSGIVINTVTTDTFVEVTSVNGMTGDVVVEPIVEEFQSDFPYKKDNLIAYENGLYLAKADFTSGSSFNPSDWVRVEATSIAWTNITGKPTFATVATTGSYNDLTNTPSLASVATSGDFGDLINTSDLAHFENVQTVDPITNTVTTGMIADGAVTTDKIANGAVTLNKISGHIVDTAQIVNGAVTTAKLADDSVSDAKMDFATTAVRFYYAQGATPHVSFAPNRDCIIEAMVVTSAKWGYAGATMSLDITVTGATQLVSRSGNILGGDQAGRQMSALWLGKADAGDTVNISAAVGGPQGGSVDDNNTLIVKEYRIAEDANV